MTYSRNNRYFVRDGNKMAPLVEAGKKKKPPGGGFLLMLVDALPYSAVPA